MSATAHVLTLVPSDDALADGALEWFTASDLAEMALPGLPSTKRRINALAVERGWARARDARGRRMARRAEGAGGGLAYHRALLPAAAQIALARRDEPVSGVEPATAPAEPTGPWRGYDALPDTAKREAERRLDALSAVETLERGGLTSSAAVAAVAGQREVSAATLWNWRRRVAGVSASDRLPLLAPDRRGGGAQAEVDPRAWKVFLSDYLRLEKPTLIACYDRTVKVATKEGWSALPHAKTLRRKLEREVTAGQLILAREGVDAHRRAAPPLKRSVAHLTALEHVNIDGHKWDVFVRWEDGSIARPMMVALQDLYSRKALAWRICATESAQDVRLCFADLFRDHGVPKACTLDNGRGFASKWITGGAPNRFRFKVKPGDPQGLLTALGVEIHWTLPYRGQSKPIERMFRDFCGRIATHPAFAGAYCGNKPDAKPENYGSRAVPIEEFRRVVDVEIAAHNSRLGRDTEMCRGVRSFDDVYAESYASSPIRRATPDQYRQALLAAEKVRAGKGGAVTLYGNTYWDESCQSLADQPLIVRFDPDALQTEVHLYDAAGRYRLTAPVWRAVGFDDVDAAKAKAKLDARRRKGDRESLKVLQLIEARELAALQPDAPEREPLSPRVIRPVRTAGGAALRLATESDADTGHPPTEGRSPARTASIDRFLAGAARLRLVGD